MAATNYTPIQLYYSTTASAAPTAGNLVNGELAINITDGKLYYKDNGGTVQVIATKGAGTIGGSNTQIQFNDGGALAGNAAMVFNKSTNVTTLTTLNLTNALGATYGGTAQSAYAQGDLLYASAVNTLSKLTIGTVNYILTSTGSVPQWVAPTSVTVQTANNLAGGAAGSVPYQSAADTTTFLAIGAANTVMTSSGTGPQWGTTLTGLTGLSTSSFTNTSLTSGRVRYSTTGGLETDSANLTFNGTTLSMTGLSNTGFSTIVKTVTLGDSNFNGSAVFAPATPAKLYIGTGTVTDVTSAASATNTAGAITAFGITPIAATNTSVTYTNASTLYIAGAPTAGTNVTITNPYSLYVAAGAAYFGGAVTVAGTISLAGVTVTSLTDSGLTSGRVTYAGTGGLLQDSANFTFNGTTVTMANDASISGLTVGKGAGAVGTNTAVGAGALASNVNGTSITAVGYQALNSTTTTGLATAVGYQAGLSNTGGNFTAVGYQAGKVNTGANTTAIGLYALVANTSGESNTAVGSSALQTNITGGYNVAVGTLALGTSTSSYNTAIGYQSQYITSSGSNNTSVGRGALYGYSGAGTGSSNTAIGDLAMFYSNSGNNNTALGAGALYSNTTASHNTALGYYAGNSVATNPEMTAIGAYAGQRSTGGYSTFVGYNAGVNQSTGDGNTFVGRGITANAGTGSTTGNNNTAMGNFAFSRATSGSYNVAIGNNALDAVTTSNYNTAVGFQAGYLNQIGTSNTFIGARAGRDTTGDTNTFVGLDAGLTVTSGTGNTYVGYGAGPNSYASAGVKNVAVGYLSGNAMTTGSKNTILGAFTGNQGGLDIRTASNYIVLSDGDGVPWWSFNGNNGVESFRQYGHNNITPVMKVSGFGYSPSSYRAIVLGGQTLAGTFNTICLGYDPSGNNSGAYSGAGGEIFVQNGTSIVQPNSANTTFQPLMVFETNGSGVRFNQNIGIGGTSPTASGTGITFPATQSASSDANTLDDYEEGTWTPNISFASGGPATTTGNTSGRYVKVGKQVTCWFYINVSSLNSGSGQAYITGLPFTNSSVIGAAEGATVAPNYWGGFASAVIPGGYVQYNQAQVLMVNLDAGTGVSVITAASMTSTPSLYANFTYFTD